MLAILYYPSGDTGPVAEYLKALAIQRPKTYVKLILDLETLGSEGLRSRRLSVRPLGEGLWELKRFYEGIQYRIFFGVWNRAAWLLHNIEKKSARTPKDDLELARKRLREVVAK